MPLDPIRECEHLVVAHGTVHHIVVQLAIEYWCSGCKPLPTEDYQLARLAKTYQPALARVRSTVILALADILPKLEKAYIRVSAYRKTMAARGKRGAQSRFGIKSPEPNAPQRHIAALPPVTPLRPHTARKYKGSGGEDQAKLAELREGEKSASGGALLSDAPTRR